MTTPLAPMPNDPMSAFAAAIRTAANQLIYVQMRVESVLPSEADEVDLALRSTVESLEAMARALELRVDNADNADDADDADDGDLARLVSLLTFLRGPQIEATDLAIRALAAARRTRGRTNESLRGDPPAGGTGPVTEPAP